MGVAAGDAGCTGASYRRKPAAPEPRARRARVCAFSGALTMTTGLRARPARAAFAFPGLCLLLAAGGRAVALEVADGVEALQAVVVTATRIPTPQLEVASSI